MAILMDGKALAAEQMAMLKTRVDALKAAGRSVGLAVILVGDDPASQVYVRNKGKACEELGILSETLRLPAETTQEALEAEIERLNRDRRIDGILVQLPLPRHLDEAKALKKIIPEKDVDGFHIENAGKLFTGQEGVVACTPKGILHMLKASGVPLSGKDRTPAYVPYNELRERYFHPFKESIEAGALTLMVNSASINGMPVHANRELLTGWLKEELGWDGMIITDWADVDNLYNRERVAEDKVHALALAVNAGIDMIMDPYDAGCCADLRKAVEDGLVPMSRIDDAVRRILRLKYRLNLFDEPVWDTSAYELRREDFIAAAKQAAIESEVLLKNEDGILPLARGTRILVTGPCSNSMRSLGGGWNYTWQGSKVEEFTEDYNTIYEALSAKFGTGNVRYVPGVAFNEAGKWYEELEPDIASAVSAARWADVIVACVGENSYCESPGNLDDLTLSLNQIDLVKALYKTGRPIVLILNEGRPRVVSG